MEYIQKTVIDIIINNLLLFTSINYVTYAKSKAIYVVSKKTNSKKIFL